MILLLLVLLQGGDSADGVLIRNEDPALQIRLPKEYKILGKEGIPPDIYGRFPYRYARKAGEEDWEWIRVTVRAAKEAPKGDAFQDAATLRLLTYGPERKDTTPESIEVSTSETKVAGYHTRIVECRFDQDMKFLAMEALVELPVGSFSVSIVGPADEEIEKRMRDDFRLMLAAVVIDTTFLTQDELRSKTERLGLVTWAALGTAALYLVAWGVYFRIHSLSLHVVRMIWLGMVALLWGYAMIQQFQLRGSLDAWNQASPFLARLYVSIPLFIVYVIATLLRVARRQSAWTWT